MAVKTKRKAPSLPPSFKAYFALLDVTVGRAALAKHIAAGNKVRVNLDLLIDNQWGSDDGTSIEFSGDVTIKKIARSK